MIRFLRYATDPSHVADCVSRSYAKHPCTSDMMQVSEELVKKYRMITPLLRKIEEAVFGTNTGKAQLLLPYYAHWERVIFRAVNTLILNALGALVKLLSAPGGKADEPGAHHAPRPLFKVHNVFFGASPCI